MKIRKQLIKYKTQLLEEAGQNLTNTNIRHCAEYGNVEFIKKHLLNK